MKIILFFVLFFYYSPVFSNEMDKCICLPGKKNCKRFHVITPIDGSIYKTHLLGIDLDNPKKDFMKRAEHHDYRLLHFGDENFFLKFKENEKLFLSCKLGVKLVDGIFHGDDISVVSSAEVVGELRKYRKKFMKYVREYNKCVYDYFSDGKISAAKPEDIVNLF